jgi:sec-independent protein translocase protein TatC
MKIPLLFFLKEIKFRFFYICFCFILSFIVSYIFVDEILYLIAKPLIVLSFFQRNFIFTNISEAFVTYLSISFYTSLISSIPLIIYNLWLFLTPGLFNFEKKFVGFFFFICFILFSLSLYCSYYMIFPFLCNFFLSFENIKETNLFNISLEAKINEYFFSLLQFILLFCLIFQLPLFLFLLIKLKVLNEKSLKDKRKIFWIFSFILAALISPPDILSQILIAIPLIILFEFSFFFLILLNQYKLK